MTEKEQIKAFESDIHKVVDRYRAEFDLTLGSAAGVLFTVATMIVCKKLDKDEDEDE